MIVNSRLTFSSLLLFVGLLAGPTRSAVAEDIFVPADYATIQAAIDAAVEGDVVLVATGEYVENLDFLGKAIELRSEDGAETTTIDGSGITGDPDNGSVVRFITGEGVGSILDGFTITGGTGNVDGWGGGILCVNTAPIIRNCIITDNTGSNGGGLYFEEESTATVENCLITDNVSLGLGGGVGGCESSPTLIDCHIEGNICEGLGGAGIGVHIHTGEMLISGCAIIDNHNTSLGFNDGSAGWFLHAFLTVEDTIVLGNTGDRSTFYFWDHESTSFTNCRIEGNVSNDQIFRVETSGDLTVDRCLIADNVGAVFSSDSPDTSFTLQRSTVANNDGLVFDDVCDSPACASSYTVHESILWGNTGSIETPASTLEITYSCVEGGFTGTGNIEDDPLFQTSSMIPYHLSSGSPCIDGGDPASALEADGSTADVGMFSFMELDFRRGDVDGDGAVSVLTDTLYMLDWGFAGGPIPICLDAADVDNNGTLSPLVDSIALLVWGFAGGDEPADPGPDTCGADLEVDDLDCAGGPCI